MKKLFLETFKLKRKKNWDKIYIAVDIHGVILVPNYKTGEICTEFYPLAKDTLVKLSRRKDIELILYTCSYSHEIEQYKKLFSDNKINFKYVNENPEVENNGYGDFTKKFYFNILLDDKAGFVPAKHWKKINKIIDVI